jgi:hypothetical protein
MEIESKPAEPSEKVLQLAEQWEQESTGKESESGYIRGSKYTFASCAKELRAALQSDPTSNEAKPDGLVDFHVDSEGFAILDEHGQTIPSHICICAAHSESECSCGAWGVPIPAAPKDQLDSR